jgi:hypothetical protein
MSHLFTKRDRLTGEVSKSCHHLVAPLHLSACSTQDLHPTRPRKTPFNPQPRSLNRNPKPKPETRNPQPQMLTCPQRLHTFTLAVSERLDLNNDGFISLQEFVQASVGLVDCGCCSLELLFSWSQDFAAPHLNSLLHLTSTLLATRGPLLPYLTQQARFLSFLHTSRSRRTASGRCTSRRSTPLANESARLLLSTSSRPDRV